MSLSLNITKYKNLIESLHQEKENKRNLTKLNKFNQNKFIYYNIKILDLKTLRFKD